MMARTKAPQHTWVIASGCLYVRCPVDDQLLKVDAHGDVWISGCAEHDWFIWLDRATPAVEAIA